MLRDEIIPYMDEIGQVHGSPRYAGQSPSMGISQNGQLYVAITHLLLKCSDTLTPEFHTKWIDMMLACKHSPGIYMRHNAAHSNNWQSPDNFIGIACSSYVFNDATFVKDILEYGQKDHGYRLKHLLAEYYPQTFWIKCASVLFGWYKLKYVYKWEPDHTLKECWLGRQPGLIATLKYAAGIEPTFIEKLGYSIGLIISAVQDADNIRNVDPANLGWMCYHIGKNKSWWCNIARKFFIRRIMKKYEGIHFGDIYNPGNETHPNGRYFYWYPDN
jgi:hypothetical protein